MRSRSMTARAHLGALILVVIGLLAACGADGGAGEEPSISPTRTPTGTLSPELPSPTRTPTATLPSPTRTPSATESPSQTAPPNPTPEPTEEPSPEPTQTPTAEPTQPPTESAEASPEEESSEEQPDEDSGVPPWLWWVVAAVVLGCIVAVPLVVRARRRGSWRRDLERQESEIVWFVRDLLPELRTAGSHEAMAGGWAVSQERLTVAEDELTVLESTAPDEAGRARARALRDTSRHARSRMQQLVARGPHDTWALDLDTLMIELEGKVHPTTSPTPPG
ncbi:MAG TPA: hypothetical protein VLA70_07705 [Nocardioides sp.]|nr:hypothetical protein [Nocardioides sp.]